MARQLPLLQQTRLRCWLKGDQSHGQFPQSFTLAFWPAMRVCFAVQRKNRKRDRRIMLALKRSTRQSFEGHGLIATRPCNAPLPALQLQLCVWIWLGQLAKHAPVVARTPQLLAVRADLSGHFRDSRHYDELPAGSDKIAFRVVRLCSCRSHSKNERVRINLTIFGSGYKSQYRFPQVQVQYNAV
jgi:hypothetical protein